ncbi:electron transport complex subunit RsxC [Chimaeribacter californicus]|uniref:Ion-translocating oxidoreductase complex subunit C n=1 Tax=Chimaeribacter californicus TaxID=2060067 RepID=A0A2N5EGM7_9GAMM|nr:electron transport complex subunit RsxC [Chimaeribacter californicus]PLR41707.1 electron transport complex subunit RsxC [Chimaeribacter californicus]
MFNLLKALNKHKIWDFAGGIHPPEMKTQSSHAPLRTMPLSDEFIIPLQQHLGPEGELLVRAGDRVLKGQPLTAGRGRTLPVHAPTSGTVRAIEPRITAHPSGLKELCVVLDADGDDRWCALSPVADYHQQSANDLMARIHQAGVAGLGGAGFPTAAKLQGGRHGVKTLIVNAAECEPYITADDRLMQEHAPAIVTGTRILCHILRPERVIIGIEDNKPEAIAALKRALKEDATPGVKLELRVIPTKYPSGGAKQLTRILTGQEVPHGKHSSSIGVLMQNVGTLYAITRAIVHGEPLIERVVTLTGESVGQPGNVWARIGTPVSLLLKEAGFRPHDRQLVIMGGPLMGFTLPHLEVPTVKITNCLLAPSQSEMGEPQAEEACIRCSQCADACPAGLLPQQLYWFSRGQEHEKARNYNLFDCIECGACAYVCPSNIPLVQYYRQEKAEIRELDQEAARAADAKARFEAKQARMEREKLAREARHKQAAVRLDDSQNEAVQAAVARVAAKKAAQPLDEAVREADRAERHARRAAIEAEIPVDQTSQSEDEHHHDADPRKAAVAAALARVKARKAAEADADAAPAAAASDTGTDDKRKAAVAAASDTGTDDKRKAAVAAALARVKAKKAVEANADFGTAEVVDAAVPTPPTDDDKRKAAVAAAVARAKAKRAAPVDAEPADAAPAEPELSAEDKRKAAVAAAVARAKAKRAAQTDAEPADAAPAEPELSAEDKRKAAVAAAVARAKAKRAAPADAEPADAAPAEPELSADDKRKAAVAAAVARAKAKRAAQTDAEPAEAAPAQADTASGEAPENHSPQNHAVENNPAEPLRKEAGAPPAGSATEKQESDPRKEAVAAAIARIKARKAAEETMSNEE